MSMRDVRKIESYEDRTNQPMAEGGSKITHSQTAFVTAYTLFV